MAISRYYPLGDEIGGFGGSAVCLKSRLSLGARPSISQSCIESNIQHLFRIKEIAKLIARSDESTRRGLCERKDLHTFTTIHMHGPFGYVGGKNRIAREIIKVFPKHTTYVEAFAGGAQVLFRKEPSRVEVLNDLDGAVVNFFRVCQQHYEELLRCLKFILVSRKWFELFENQDPDALTDIQRAARFFYLQKTSYAGLVRHQNYKYSVVGPPNLNPGQLPELIRKTHERLQRIQIECLPYETIVKRFDRPSTLFYLDPPYFGRKLYKFNFTGADFVTLEERLREIHGKFVLSLNDVPEVRKIFRRFHFKQIELAYTAQQTAGKRYRELLITNYRIP
jgi:DNA adenine methylase